MGQFRHVFFRTVFFDSCANWSQWEYNLLLTNTVGSIRLWVFSDEYFPLDSGIRGTEPTARMRNAWHSIVVEGVTRSDFIERPQLDLFTPWPVTPTLINPFTLFICLSSNEVEHVNNTKLCFHADQRFYNNISKRDRAELNFGSASFSNSILIVSFEFIFSTWNSLLFICSGMKKWRNGEGETEENGFRHVS